MTTSARKTLGPRGTRQKSNRIGRPPGVEGDDTKMSILLSARRCFGTYGYVATTNRMVADEAGVTAAAVHHHFGRKKDLMLAVWEATTDEQQTHLREWVD